MPRTRTRPINKFIQEWMDEEGCKTLKQLSEKTGIPYETLRGWADLDGDHKYLAGMVAGARARGMKIGDFVEGLLAS